MTGGVAANRSLGLPLGAVEASIMPRYSIEKDLK